MNHPIYQIVSIKIIAPYTLEVQFSDQSVQVIDFEPVLHGEMYGPLKDITVFNQVTIDHEVKTIVWPNGADFDPAILHDWDEYAADLAQRAESWEVMVS